MSIPPARLWAGMDAAQMGARSWMGNRLSIRCSVPPSRPVSLNFRAMRRSPTRSAIRAAARATRSRLGLASRPVAIDFFKPEAAAPADRRRDDRCSVWRRHHRAACRTRRRSGRPFRRLGSRGSDRGARRRRGCTDTSPSCRPSISRIRPRGESASLPSSRYVGHAGRHRPHCTQVSPAALASFDRRMVGPAGSGSGTGSRTSGAGSDATGSSRASMPRPSASLAGLDEGVI